MHEVPLMYVLSAPATHTTQAYESHHLSTQCLGIHVQRGLQCILYALSQYGYKHEPLLGPYDSQYVSSYDQLTLRCACRSRHC